MCTIKQYRFSLVRNVERSISNKMDTFCCEGNVHFFHFLLTNVSAVSSKVGELLVCILVVFRQLLITSTLMIHIVSYSACDLRNKYPYVHV